MLGTSPETETGEAKIRPVLGQYGEILDAQKGFISETPWLHQWYLDSENDSESWNVFATFPDEHVVEDNVDQNKVEVRELDHLVLHVQQDYCVGGVSVGKPGGAACSQEQEWMFRQVGNH